MPEPAENRLAEAATDEEQPQLRRRFRRRNADGSDAWTGTVPAVTPEPTAPPRPIRSSSWAEAAAVAAALSDTPPAAAAPPTPARRPVAAPPSSVTESLPEPEAPAADATALPTSFVREQKPRPKKG